LVLAAALAGQAGWLAATTSGTPDETTYLRAGLNIYHHGDFGALAQDGIAPLPVLLSFAVPALLDAPGYARSIRVARASAILLIGFPLVLLVYRSLLHACGRAAAVTGTAVMALSPNIIAHAGLAATDMCFIATTLAALLALVRYVERRTHTHLVILAIALGAALAAKYSAVTLFPAVMVVLVLTDGGDHCGARRVSDAVALTCALFAASLLIVWALHGFAMAPAKLAALGSHRLPAAIAGMISQAQHQRGGHPAFLFGRISAVGWWYYMPIALALKSTPAELLMIVFGLFVVATGWRHASASALVWRVTIVTFSAFALVNRLDLGVRYVLVLVPLLVFVTLERWWRSAARRLMLGGCAAIVVAQGSSAVAIGPHYLSYFNRLSGGPANGYRYLADSNIDWGQDLPALREALARVGARKTLLSYFGNAPFDAYGVSADSWTGDVQCNDRCWDWVAISVTHLDGLFVPGDPFEPFRSLAPSDRAGYSILLYPTSRADVRDAVAVTGRRWRASP
jgi:4-amino-4-deoxy-L-arabinose transferase-like glycosyltransferase